MLIFHPFLRQNTTLQKETKHNPSEKGLREPSYQRHIPTGLFNQPQTRRRNLHANYSHKRELS